MLLNGELRPWRNRCSSPHAPPLHSAPPPLHQLYLISSAVKPNIYGFMWCLHSLLSSLGHCFLFPLLLSSTTCAFIWVPPSQLFSVRSYVLQHVNQNASRANSQHQFYCRSHGSAPGAQWGLAPLNRTFHRCNKQMHFFPLAVHLAPRPHILSPGVCSATELLTNL